MSIAPQRDEKHPKSQQTLSHNTAANSQQIAEYIKQKIGELQPSESEEKEQQFQEGDYKILSSGVYQMSSESYSEQIQQEQGQKQRKQIEMEDGQALKKLKPQNSYLSEKAVEDSVQRQQVTESHVKQFISRALQPKQVIEIEPRTKPQDDFVYPSLMEQSNAENEYKVEQEVAINFQRQQVKAQNLQNLKKANKDNQYINMKASLESQQLETKQKQGQKSMKNEDPLYIHEEQKRKVILSPFNASHVLQKVSTQLRQEQKPSLILSNQSAKLRILGYQKQYFVKIQTQVYQIQFFSNQQNYIINRKFADFVGLDQLIRLKYPGYILYPFPENSLEFFKTIKLSVGTELQKAILLEKRLLELEKYLNFLLKHKQLGSSQIFKAFIVEFDEQFTERMAYLQKTLEKEQQRLSQSKIKVNYKNIKSLVMSGMSFFTSYVSKNQKNAMYSTLLAEIRRKCEVLKLSFAEVYMDLEKYKLFTSNIHIKAQKLLQIYESNIAMKSIESSIDSVLKLSSKMASSNPSYQLQKNWVEDLMLSKIYFFARIFSQVEEQVQYRQTLLQKADLLGQQEAKLALKIIERVYSFDSHFVQDWVQLKTKFEQQYFDMIGQLSSQWQLHCSHMSKIWK